MALSLSPASSISIGETIIERNKAFLIAEMACAHDGDQNKARDLINVAALSGCDAVQLQFFNAEANVVNSHKLLPLLREIEFTANQWEALVDHARQKNIHVFVCAYDAPSLELALSLKVDGIKFNSADLTNLEMLETLAESGLPFTLGTGASRMDEIGMAIDTVLAAGSTNFILMHGIQSFPTDIGHANIRKLKTFVSTFGSLVGYADHTSGDDPYSPCMDLLALGCGACVFEKHYTLNRAEKGTDYQAALNPKNLERYVGMMRTGVKALGESAIRPFSPEELNYRQFQKKQVAAAKDLKKGACLQREDLDLLRMEEPGGVEAGSISSLIGKTLVKGIAKHERVLISDVD